MNWYKRVRGPEFFGDEKGPNVWWHVQCVAADAPPGEASSGPGSGGPQTPCAVSLYREGLEAGSQILPGGWRDLYGPGVWVMGPKSGPSIQDTLVRIERRNAPTFGSDTELGHSLATTSFKATDLGVAIEPFKWHVTAGNVVGIVGVTLSVSGPRRVYQRDAHGEVWSCRPSVWIGTHVDASRPPPPSAESMKTMGGLWPLRVGREKYLRGNPTLYATAFHPGLVLHQAKHAAGRQFELPPAPPAPAA